MGKVVQVVSLSDETISPAHIGRKGIVKGKEIGQSQWPVGETPEDPLYVVRLAPGWGMPIQTEVFWTEEII